MNRKRGRLLMFFTAYTLYDAWSASRHRLKNELADVDAESRLKADRLHFDSSYEELLLSLGDFEMNT